MIINKLLCIDVFFRGDSKAGAFSEISAAGGAKTELTPPMFLSLEG
jgi:hypothetical protein